jgi:hypothetical protein
MRSRVRRYVRARLERRSTRQAGLALVYHRIGEPPGDPRYELVPALSTRLFETQLNHLRTAYRVVPPSQLLEATLERRAGDRFPVALTFDDDLRSHIDIVGPALQRAGLPAAFFLCGASLDASHSFWWEDLQESPTGGIFRLFGFARSRNSTSGPSSGGSLMPFTVQRRRSSA